MKYLIVAATALMLALCFSIPSSAAPVTSMARATFTPLATSGPLATPMPTPTNAPDAYPAPDEKRHSGDRDKPSSTPAPLRRDAPCTSPACRYLKDRAAIR